MTTLNESACSSFRSSFPLCTQISIPFWFSRHLVLHFRSLMTRLEESPPRSDGFFEPPSSWVARPFKDYI